MHTMKSALGLGIVCVSLLVVASTAIAQNFVGQNISVIVNYSAGGPTDVQARIVAEYLPKYLQGVRSIVVRNVPGAGGIIGVNTLGEASTKDRPSIGFFTWDFLDQILQNPTLHVRYSDLKAVAGMRESSLLYIRRDTAPGITKPADVAKAHLFRVGALSPGNWSTIRQRLALDLLGARYETIPGYKGFRDIDTAMLQGDIQLTSNSLPGYFAFAKINLVDKGIAMPLFQYDRADGLPGRSPDLPAVPTFLELYKDIWGPSAMPSGTKWQALQVLQKIMGNMTRAIFMPPDAPTAAVEEMRRAFENLAKDPQFIATYEKVAMTQPRFITGVEASDVVTTLANIQPSMVSFFDKYVKEGR
jgi:tripartite-type tricarboxylate transporter receptor subunit TctC